MCETDIFNFKTETDEIGNKSIILESETGFLIYDNNSKKIKNIKVLINDHIYISFDNENFPFIFNQEFNIQFNSHDGFKINMNCIFYKKNQKRVEATSSNLNCTKGDMKHGDLIKSYFFIENLKIDALHDTDSFNIYKNTKLKLDVIRSNIFPHATSYFYMEHNNEMMIKRTYKILKGLLKYYSSDTASMRIMHLYNSDYCEWNFTNISQYSKFQHNSYFRDYPGNFFEFIKSTFNKFDKNYKNLKEVIDYLALYNLEKYLDVKIPILSLILERMSQINEINCKFSGTSLQKGLRTLMDKLNLEESQINTFFKENDIICDDDFLSEIQAVRNKALHGKPLISIKIDDLMINYIMILLLKMLDTKCEIYSTISGSINSEKFLEKFIPQGTKCLKKDGKFYLPLKSIKYADLNVGDRYGLEVFKKDDYPYFVLVKK